MALTIKVPRTLLEEEAIDKLGHSFRSNGGTNLSKGEEVWFPFDNTGENYFTKDAYAVCNAYDLACEGGIFYAILTETKKCTIVPVDYPANNGEDISELTYEDYFRKGTQYDLGDGTWLFRMVRQGKSLSNADRLIYEDDLDTLMIKSKGVEIISKLVM